MPSLLLTAAMLCALPGIGRPEDFTVGGVFTEAKLYFTAPARWDKSDWMFFGGSVAATWPVSEVTGSAFANTEAYTMLEAMGFSALAAPVFKFAVRRERPDETTAPHDWRAGGSLLPSHATAAFAIGTVFAESGNDSYRWLRSAMSYGMAAATAYLRLHDSEHRLSDTAAGAALRIATGRFTTRRRLKRAHDLNLALVPYEYGGFKLACIGIVE